MNKKALSDVIATVLIILLALAAVAIVWSVVNSMIGQSGTAIDLGQKCLLVEAKPVECNLMKTTNDPPVITGVTVKAQLSNGDPADISKLMLIVEDTKGITSTEDYKTALQRFGTTPATAVPLPAGFDTASGELTAKVAVVVKDAEGNTKVCDPSPVVMPCT